MEETNLFGEVLHKGVAVHLIDELFEFWKSTFNKRGSTVLDEKRRDKLATALRAYGMESCKTAILGCSLSAWHTGKNPGNKQYTDITLIFRNAEKVEMFISLYESESKAEAGWGDWLEKKGCNP